MSEASQFPDAAALSRHLASQLDAAGQDYAIGGAIALGFWGAPRGTLDVDLTLYLPPEKPSHCIWLLQDLGCELASSAALESFREHGFCRVVHSGLNVDVFLPSSPFYATARARRKRVQLGDQGLWIWDAETLIVFKMMFFRRKDLADVEQILRSQGHSLDRAWIRAQIEGIYGARDPRLTQWDEISQEINPS
jgi:hypothetical protein